MDFILSLPKKRRAKILKILNELERLGPSLREPYSKYLRDGIFEIRSQIGHDNDRVFYFYDKNKIVILTNGFEKKTNKTPRKYIDQAKAYMQEYFERQKYE